MSVEFAISLVVAESTSQGLPGVRVDLYETPPRRQFGTGITGPTGEVHIQGTLPPLLPGNRQTLYAAVYSRKGELVLTTPVHYLPNQTAPKITIAVTQALIARYRLFPAKTARTPAVKQQEWRDYWKKRTSDPRDPRGRIDLCLTRTVIDMVAGAANPEVELQKSVAIAFANEKMTTDQIASVSGLAAKARDMIDSSGLLGRGPCSAASDPKDVWHLLTGHGGPLYALNQALVQPEPNPLDGLGPAQAGVGKQEPFPWVPKCVDLFQAGALTGQELSDMQRFYDPALQILAPARISEIKVYDQALKHTVRDADPATKTVQLSLLDGNNGLVSSTLQMAVPPSDPNFLVDVIDPADFKQVLVVDTRPGQTITIVGDGFISAQASVSVVFARWQDIPADAPAPAVLQVQGFARAPDWPHSFDVHGSATYGGDRIIFDWPISAFEPGLYRLQFGFDNQSGLKTITHAQTDTDCTVGLTDTVAVQPLFFAVLPGLTPQPMRVLASEVDTVRITSPTFWPDDVALTGTTQFQRVTYDASDPANPGLVVGEQSVNAWDKGDKVMWWNQNWRPGSPSLLPDGEATHLLDFGPDFTEIMTVGLSANEIDSGFDRQLLAVLGKVMMVALGVLATALILVAASFLTVIVIDVAVIVAVLSFILGSPAGLAAVAPVDAAIAGAVISGIWLVTGALITATWAAVFGSFPLIDSALNAFLTGNDSICNATVVLSSNELSLRLSNVRFQQRVWQFQPHVTSSSDSFSAAITADSGGLREVFDGSKLGAEYKVHMDLLPTM